MNSDNNQIVETQEQPVVDAQEQPTEETEEEKRKRERRQTRNRRKAIFRKAFAEAKSKRRRRFVKASFKRP